MERTKGRVANVNEQVTAEYKHAQIDQAVKHFIIDMRELVVFQVQVDEAVK